MLLNRTTRDNYTADSYDWRRSVSLILLSLLFLPLPALAECEPYVEIGGAVKHSNSISTSECIQIFVPLEGEITNQLLFSNAKIFYTNDGTFNGNIFLGYRKLYPSSQRMLGIYGGYKAVNDFNQLAAGIEYWENLLFVGGNVYKPIGKSKLFIGETKNIETTNTRYEKALPGIDAEIGYAITDNLTCYAGGYYFAAKGDSIVGPKAKVIYDYMRPAGRILGILDGIKIEVGAQRDKQKGSAFFAEIKFKIGTTDSDRKTNYIGFERHMTETVRSSTDITVIQKTEETKTIGEKSITKPSNSQKKSPQPKAEEKEEEDQKADQEKEPENKPEKKKDNIPNNADAQPLTESQKLASSLYEEYKKINNTLAETIKTGNKAAEEQVKKELSVVFEKIRGEFNRTRDLYQAASRKYSLTEIDEENENDMIYVGTIIREIKGIKKKDPSKISEGFDFFFHGNFTNSDAPNNNADTQPLTESQKLASSLYEEYKKINSTLAETIKTGNKAAEEQVKKELSVVFEKIRGEFNRTRDLYQTAFRKYSLTEIDEENRKDMGYVSAIIQEIKGIKKKDPSKIPEGFDFFFHGNFTNSDAPNNNADTQPLTESQKLASSLYEEYKKINNTLAETIKTGNKAAEEQVKKELSVVYEKIEGEFNRTRDIRNAVFYKNNQTAIDDARKDLLYVADIFFEINGIKKNLNPKVVYMGDFKNFTNSNVPKKSTYSTKKTKELFNKIGLQEGSTIKQMVDKCNELKKLYHPDKSEKENAQELFIYYSNICDEIKRRLLKERS